MSVSPEVEKPVVFSQLSNGITEYPITPDAEETWAEIVRLGLTYHVAELDIRGYTIIPPDKVAPAGFAGRLLERVLAAASRRTGDHYDVNVSPTDERLKAAFGLSLTYMLFEDTLIQQALLNPVGLAMATYLLGKNAMVSDCAALLKGPGGVDLQLHADNIRIPPPFPAQPQICNVTWLLTDYTRENGALCLVPGSHRQCRHPLKGEGIAERVAVEAPAGSMVVFSGNTWHGAFARETPGLRASLIFYMSRPHLWPQVSYREEVSDEMLARYPERFRKLVGLHMNYGWKAEGPRDEDADSYNMGRHAYE